MITSLVCGKWLSGVREDLHRCSMRRECEEMMRDWWGICTLHLHLIAGGGWGRGKMRQTGEHYGCCSNHKAQIQSKQKSLILNKHQNAFKKSSMALSEKLDDIITITVEYCCVLG